MSSTDKPTVRVVAAVIESDGKYLITQRMPHAVMPLLWEFPGGKVEDGELPDQAIVRELSEELCIQTSSSCLAPVTFVIHHYQKLNIILLSSWCEIMRFSQTSYLQFNNKHYSPYDEMIIKNFFEKK